MKINVLYFLLGMFVFFTACSDDDDNDCTGDPLSEVIVGTWKADGEDGTFEFLSDGTLNDPSEILGGDGDLTTTEVNTYNVIDDNTLELTTESDVFSSSIEFPITSYDCDEIEINILGITGKLTKQ